MTKPDLHCIFCHVSRILCACFFSHIVYVVKLRYAIKRTTRNVETLYLNTFSNLSSPNKAMLINKESLDTLMTQGSELLLSEAILITSGSARVQYARRIKENRLI